MLGRILGLMVPLAVLALPDSLADFLSGEGKPNDDKANSARNRRRRRNRRSGGRGTESHEGKLEQEPAKELENDDSREDGGGGPGDPVRSEHDSAVEGDLQPVIDQPAETPPNP